MKNWQIWCVMYVGVCEDMSAVNMLNAATLLDDTLVASLASHTHRCIYICDYCVCAYLFV